MKARATVEESTLYTCISLVVVHSVCLFISLVISDYMVFGFNKDIRIRIRIRT